MESENKSKIDQVMADIEDPHHATRFPDGTTQQCRDYLTTIWRMQDANGFRTINNPNWYKPAPLKAKADLLRKQGV